MSPSGSDENADKGPADGRNSSQVALKLPCPDCASIFPNLSKLNKHRNSHDRPHQCFADGCYDRFAQKQTLNRHIETKHSNSSNPTKFYHCTVDGCKYSSIGLWRKKFARSDQVKEHIKDYGHYGPHSANDRPRRPGAPLFPKNGITARFEEWTSNENEGSQPRRTVQSCVYSEKTRLWHTDNVGETFLRGDSAEAVNGHKCPVPGCYYESRPPETCEAIVFKTLKALREHCRRAHASPNQENSPATEVGETESSESTAISLDSTESSYSSRSVSVGPDMTDFLGLELSTFGRYEHQTFCVAGRGMQCYCLPCCHRETATQQQADSLPSFQLQGTSEIRFQNLSASSSLRDSYSPQSNTIASNEQYQFDPSSISSTSLIKQDSPKSDTKRLSCKFPRCSKTFSRKYDLQRHVVSKHFPGTLFGCHLCERQFGRADKLAEHLRKHPVRPGLEPMKSRFTVSDSSECSNYSRLTLPAYPSGREFMPSDTLMRAGPNSASGDGRSTGTFQPSPWKWSGFFETEGLQSTSPKAMQTGTGDSPSRIDETGPESTIWEPTEIVYDYYGIEEEVRL